MALNDYKITSTDEQGKLHTGQPQRLSDAFQTYQEVQTFMDSHGQLVKVKHNGLIDEVGLSLKQITDKGYVDAPLITDLDVLVNGKYSYSGTINGINATWTIDVTKHKTNGITQVAKSTWSSTEVGRKKMLFRIKYDNIWDTWSEIPTTDKIDNLFEVGTWTPSLRGSATAGTFTANSANKGTYTRNNKLVNFTCWCRGTLTDATGVVCLAGLPKTPKEVFVAQIGSAQKVTDSAKYLVSFASNVSTMLLLQIHNTDKTGLSTTDINGQEVLFCISGAYEIA